jgi:hypothetical protein
MWELHGVFLRYFDHSVPNVLYQCIDQSGYILSLFKELPCESVEDFDYGGVGVYQVNPVALQEPEQCQHVIEFVTKQLLKRTNQFYRTGACDVEDPRRKKYIKCP